MNEQELQEIRERCEELTKGPWANSKTLVYSLNEDFIGIKKIASWIENKHDAEFIAHAREDIPKLLDEVERLNEELEQINQLRPAVVEFAKEMEKKLKENDHKVHWSECTTYYLLSRLDQERMELLEAYEAYKLNPNDETKSAVMKECADVGNFSMMISDNMRTNFHGKRRK